MRICTTVGIDRLEHDFGAAGTRNNAPDGERHSNEYGIGGSPGLTLRQRTESARKAGQARDLKRKAREDELQSWPYQKEVASTTMSLSWLAAGIEEAPSAPIVKMH